MARLVYRVLAFVILPRRLWRQTGRDLLHTFDAILEEARRESSRSVTRVYLSELRELFRGAFQLRFGVHRVRRAPLHQLEMRRTNSGGNTMEGWMREMRLAVRSMVKRPGFAALAIVTLALGIGANTAIFSVIQGSILAQLPFADPDRLVWLSDGHEDLAPVGVDQSIPNLMDLRDGSRLLESVAFYTYGDANLATEESPDRVRMLRVSSEWLSVLGTPPQIGRDLAQEDDVAGAPRVALLTDEIWRTRFGADPNIVGRDLSIDSEPVTGVEAVGLVNRLPLLGGTNLTNFPVYGDPERVSHFVSVRAVSPGYFDAIGVPLLAGRWLNTSEFADSGATISILINETLARDLFQGGDPLGQLVGPDWTNGGFLVVGVVGDILGGNPTRPAPPAYYFPMALGPELFRSVVVKATGDPLTLLPTLRQILRRMDPEVPIFQVRTLEEIARSRLGMGRFAQSLFGVFAALALLLGAVGIYGVMSFAVSRRAREFGVRLALGASRGSVLRLVLGQGARLTVPGVFVGLAAAMASAKLLQSILFEVSPLDPLTYVAVALVLGLVSLGASYLPAYRATRLDPITSLREE